MRSSFTLLLLAFGAITAHCWTSQYSAFTGLRPSRKALVPAYGSWDNITSPEHLAFRRSIEQRADCTNLGNRVGAFCGDICPCATTDPDSGEDMYCNAGRCSLTAPAPFVTCETTKDCPADQGCGYPVDPGKNYTGPLVCGGKWTPCTKQSDCLGQYVCVNAQYDSVVRGADDKANCDGADAGQALICDKSDPNADSFCQQNDRLWNVGCGGVRNGSPLTGVCNGAGVSCTLATPDAHTDLDTDCFWGYCVNRPDISSTPYCTWKPGPCTEATEASDCDNGLQCGSNGYCGGPGAPCSDSNFCGDPYPCQIEPTGEGSFCRDIDASSSSGGAAVPYDQNAGLGTMCSTNSNADCAGQGTSSCGATASGATNPGVCGGAGSTCSRDSQCVTGACRGYQCIPWQETTDLAIDDECQYSVQCNGDNVCVDDGTGTARCRLSTSLRARLCDYYGSQNCDQDPTYKNCGAARSGSEEPGVCGGQGAQCTVDSDCFEGVCAGDNTCFFNAASPQATTKINRKRLLESRCPLGSTMCPTGQIGRTASGYECINIMSTIDSCGGCMYGEEASGRDCTDIDHVSDVSCEGGKCKIKSCEVGWTPTGNGSACVQSKKRRGLF